MSVRELLEKRERLSSDVRSLIQNPAGSDGDLDAEQAKKFGNLKDEIEKLDSQIKRQAFVDELDRRADGAPVNGGDGNFETECRQFSIVKAIAGEAGLKVDDGREREVSQELSRRSGQKFQGIAVPMGVFERRVVSTAAPIGGPGSNVIATDHLADRFIDILRSQLVTTRLGATVISGLTGNVDIPRLKTSATTGWVAENTALTPSDSEYDKVSMTPKHVGCITEFSRNMLQQSSPDIEALTRQDFAALLARAIDTAALNGAGGDEPTGILQTSGVDTATSFSAADYDALYDLVNVVEEGDSQVSGFAMTPRIANTLRATPAATVATAGAFVMSGDTLLGGLRAVPSTQMPSGNIIAGNWADLLIGYWSAFDLLVNPFASTAYSKGNVQIRGMLTADVAVRHVESFAAATNGPATV